VLLESWLDPARTASLRYRAREHRLFSTREERVEMFPDQSSRRSAAGDGRIHPASRCDTLSLVLSWAHSPPRAATAISPPRQSLSSTGSSAHASQ
jgi:hypothetical protein